MVASEKKDMLQIVNVDAMNVMSRKQVHGK